MNNINDYYHAIEKVWNKIEEAIEDHELDLDIDIQGSVCTLTNDKHEQIVISRQEPKRELWLASKAGASHYKYENQEWVNTQDQLSFWHYLNLAFVALDIDHKF